MCLLPARGIGQPPSLLPGLLLPEPTPDHSDKDILALGLNAEEEGNRERQSTNPIWTPKLMSTWRPYATDEFGLLITSSLPPPLNSVPGEALLRCAFLPNYSQNGTCNQYREFICLPSKEE